MAAIAEARKRGDLGEVELLKAEFRSSSEA
jgi:hypothetical protein